MAPVYFFSLIFRETYIDKRQDWNKLTKQLTEQLVRRSPLKRMRRTPNGYTYQRQRVSEHHMYLVGDEAFLETLH